VRLDKCVYTPSFISALGNCNGTLVLVLLEAWPEVPDTMTSPLVIEHRWLVRDRASWGRILGRLPGGR
jgi:hypothetical protein